jgi:serine/threonine protein kinase
VRRFLSNIADSQKIDHPQLAKIYEVGQDDPFFVLRKWIKGENLNSRLQKSQRLTPEEAVAFLLQIISPLQEAYQGGIVHKNLKTSNVIITPDNIVNVIDFSLPPTISHYLSPEQCKGRKSDVRSDIYSLGIIYYQCLAGKLPFADGTSKEIMTAHLHQPPPNLLEICPQLSPEFADLSNKMLQKKEENRYRDYKELIEAAKNVLKLDNAAKKEPGEMTLELTAENGEDGERDAVLIPQVIGVEDIFAAEPEPSQKHHVTERVLKRIEDKVEIGETRLFTDTQKLLSANAPLTEELKKTLEQMADLTPFLKKRSLSVRRTQ